MNYKKWLRQNHKKNMGAREFELKKLELDYAFKQRNFEIDNFWKRGWFFGALLIALAGGYFKLHSEASTKEYSIYISFLTFVVSFAQSLMNRGSKYWQERWEYKTMNRESALKIDITKTRKYKELGLSEKYYIDSTIRDKGENPFIRSARFSVSKLTILVWDIITICCLCLLLNEMASLYFLFFYDIKLNDELIKSINVFKFLVFLGLIFVYLLLILVDGEFYQGFTKSKEYKDIGRETKYKEDVENYVENKIETYPF